MNLNLKSKMRLKLAKMLDLKFESIATDSITLHYDGELEVGTEVFSYDEEGNLTIPADGVYETDTHTLTIEQGIVVEMVEKEVEDEVDVELEGEEVDTPADHNLLARVEVLEGQIKQLVEIIDVTKDKNFHLSTGINFKNSSSTYWKAFFICTLEGSLER